MISQIDIFIEDTDLLVLFGYFLFLFFLLLDCFIVLPRLFKWWDEVVKGTEEFIALSGGGILGEQATNSVKLKTIEKLVRVRIVFGHFWQN